MWDPAIIQAVWEKGHIRRGQDPDVIRVDDFGNAMLRNRYGDRDSPYGWEIDHIVRVSDHGTDVLANLRPLQWEANAARR